MPRTFDDTVPDTSHGPLEACPAAIQYVAAVLAVLAALLIRMLLAPYLGGQFPFVTVYFVILIVAWNAGLRPALLAIAVGYLGATYFFVPPYFSLATHGISQTIGAGFFLFMSLATAALSEARRTAQARAEATALDSLRKEKAIRVSEAHKAAILESALDGIVTMDHEGRIVEFNPAAETMFGFAQEQVVGREMAQFLIPPATRDRHRQGLAHYLTTGDGPVIGKRVEISAQRADGTEFPVELAITVIPGGERPTFSGHIRDVSARKKVETQERFLAEASDLLASSLDYQTTLQSVGQLAVPHLADWCVIHLVTQSGDENGQAELELVTVAHVDPARVQSAREASRRYPPRPDSPSGPGAVVRSGKSQWITSISDDMIRAAAQDDEHYQILSAAGMKSYLCVPLVARGKTLGAITFVGAESGHKYVEDDLALAEELARRAAIAVDNAMLFQEAQQEIKERQIAQEALKESRDYYRSLTEAVPQLVWTTRSDGVPDYFNRHWVDYTGQTPDDTRSWWKGGVHPDDLPQTLEHWNAAVRTGEPYEIEYRLKRTDGVYRWFLARGVPLKDDRGDTIKWFGTCTDIDRQKREAEQQRFLARLSAETRTIASPDEVMWTSMQLLGEHLSASRSTYGVVDDESDLVTIRRDCCMEGESILGSFTLTAFGPAVAEDLRSGRTVIVKDASSDVRTAQSFESNYQPIGVHSYISVPLVKGGRLVSILSVHMIAPRAWTEDEAELVEEVAERTWLAIQSAQEVEVRQRAESALSRSEERFRAFVERASDAIVFADLEGRYVDANSRAHTMLGRTRDDLVGKPIAELLPAEDVSRFERLREYLVADRTRTDLSEWRLRRTDGDYVPVEISANILPDGRWALIVRDITERKEAEEARANLAAIVHSSTDAIVSTDLNGIVTSWNLAAERIYRYPALEMIGKSKSLIVPPELPNDLAAILQKIQAGERVEHFETVRVRKDQTRVNVSISVAPILDGSGKVIGASTIARDITEKVRHVQEIEALNSRLQRSIQETHHRVKNNLQIMAALAELQTDDGHETVPVSAMQRIGQHTRSLAAVHDLLVQGIQTDAHADRLSTSATLGKLVPLLRDTTGGREIDFEVDDFMLPVREGSSLALLVSELVGNAVKHGAGAITIALRADGGTARLDVTDQGPGFAEDFDPAEAASTGLQLIESTGTYDLRGTLTFENLPAGGGWVQVVFPIPVLDQ